MKYEAKIFLTKDETEYVNKVLSTSPTCASDCFGEDETYTHSVTFPDGCFVCVDICGVRYEEDSDNLPWTQAVLYNKDGCEITYTEPEGDFFGEWYLESYDGDEYVVEVVPFASENGDDDGNNDDETSNEDKIFYYYELTYFYDRKNSGSHYVKTTLCLNDMDEDSFLYELELSGEYKDIDYLSITNVFQMDEDEYNESIS